MYRGARPGQAPVYCSRGTAPCSYAPPTWGCVRPCSTESWSKPAQRPCPFPSCVPAAVANEHSSEPCHALALQVHSCNRNMLCDPHKTRTFGPGEVAASGARTTARKYAISTVASATVVARSVIATRSSCAFFDKSCFFTFSALLWSNRLVLATANRNKHVVRFGASPAWHERALR